MQVGDPDFKHHIQQLNLTMRNAQWSDQYSIAITRQAPTTPIFITEHDVKSISFGGKGLEFDSPKIGNINYAELTGSTETTLSITFTESQDQKINNFLLMKSDTIPIMPTDGTFLLQKDWFFNIAISSANSNWDTKLIVRGEFVLSGGIEKSFTADGGSMQEITATFKPKMDNILIYG